MEWEYRISGFATNILIGGTNECISREPLSQKGNDRVLRTVLYDGMQFKRFWTISRLES